MVLVLPLGGYCKIAGMVDESLGSQDSDNEPKNNEFRSKNTFQKLWILSAGVIMNFILSIVIFTFLFFNNGRNELVESPIISEVHDNIITFNDIGDTMSVISPASIIGLKKDDTIKKIDNILIDTWSDISLNLSNKGDSDVIIEWITEEGDTNFVALGNLIEDLDLRKKEYELRWDFITAAFSENEAAMDNARESIKSVRAQLLSRDKAVGKEPEGGEKKAEEEGEKKAEEGGKK